MLKANISASEWGAQHSFAGQKMQQECAGRKTQIIFMRSIEAIPKSLKNKDSL